MLGLKQVALWAALCACASHASVDYCGAGVCGGSGAHTFCRYPDGPGPACSGYTAARLSGAEKARLVARLNQRRAEAARGALHLPPAADMLALRWVEELAREAQIWADQCVPPSYPEQHDACRDLYAVSVGQCVASVEGEAPGLRPESLADTWFLQGRQRALSLYTMDSENAPVDFAQMLWSRTYLVGCARSRFMVESAGRLRAVTRLVCNFAPRWRRGAGAGAALWAPGAPAAACPPPARADPAARGLCAFHPNETFTYDFTNSTVLKEQLVLDTVLEIERNDSLNYQSSLDQIYLTKMMVASMINQTQEVTSTNMVTIETMTTEDTNIYTNSTEKIEKEIDDVISKIISNASTTPITKKALNMIGRPKSYNMDELNAVHKDSENGSSRPVGAFKQDDVYRDYELDDITESNELEYTASVTEIIITTALASSVTQSDETDNATATNIVNESPSHTTTTETIHSSNSEISNATHSDVENELATIFVQNDILKTLLDLSQKTEENPSDPETARQLDEALKRMEKVLAAPVSSSKVRRELRPRAEEGRSEQPSRQPSQQPVPPQEGPSKLAQEQKTKEIGAPDAAPILAIINKYAPLIKNYESFFSRSDASNTTRSLLLLLGCIMSTAF